MELLQYEQEMSQMNVKNYLILICIALCCHSCAIFMVKEHPYDYSKMDKPTRQAYELTHDFLEICKETEYPVSIPVQTRIDTILINAENAHISIYFNPFFGYIPLREQQVEAIYNALNKRFQKKFKKYTLTVFALNTSIQELVPNYYRTSKEHWDRSRLPTDDIRPVPLIRKLNQPWEVSKGLYNRYIALWPSHGWYYENKLNRWEWQRARVFQTVEDLLPFAFIEPYLLPMLENSGAHVFIPRERDIQTHEIIIDYDSHAFLEQSYQEKSTNNDSDWHNGPGPGFAVDCPPYVSGQNPFLLGTYRRVMVSREPSARINWVPDFPEDGEYGVYISYVQSDSNITDAHYHIHHLGGTSDFLVNQQIGGGTWIFIGKFKFAAGQSKEHGSVVLSNESHENGQYVVADAVRFGGGMGNIARDGLISGRPRFSEAARYYLQYAGMPDTLVYNLNADNIDYNDDYQSRGEWVNYLKGAPFGPNRNRNVPGLGLPIDLSLAFHTDAGYTRNDTVIGTLMIYSSKDADTMTVFPDGMSRLANRDFADILQTQLVEDIRRKYDPIWTRRYLWDRPYSEAYRPNVPAALLELLSHHNFLDMKFALDPRFRFDTSRSIYKAMLKFLATQYEYDYVVQPLPVSHFVATFNENHDVVLSWRPVHDPLEPSAVPQKYRVYQRREHRDFEPILLVDTPTAIIKGLEENILHSFKVSALNEGGESFPSEILSVCRTSPQKGLVLVINGFDRICGPATLEAGPYLGFADFWDQGVPDRYDFKYIGSQYDFQADSPWLDDDAPGHGASHGNFETKRIAGNTFDYPFVHGLSLRQAGYAFVSVSDEAVEEGLIQLDDYEYIDLILGEEKTTDWPKPGAEQQFTAFSPLLQERLQDYCQPGKNLFVSGAYVGTDLYRDKNDSSGIRFAEEVLKFKHRTNYAVKEGAVFSVNADFLEDREPLPFHTDLNPDVYAVEAPDAIEPNGPLARTLMRYTENNTSAVVGYKGAYNVLVMGFPFETIIREKDRHRLMQAIMEFFNPAHSGYTSDRSQKAGE